MNAIYKYIVSVSLFTCHFSVWSQSIPKPINELVDTANSAWPAIQNLAGKAGNKVMILPATKAKASQALLSMQRSTNLPLAAVAYYTGGILVDDGWIRILGSGHDQFKRSLPEWNRNKTSGKAYTLIADDVIGGYFIINNGAFGIDSGGVYYFSPRTLKYKAMNLNYNKFLDFCFNGDLVKFYEGLRWKTWRQDVKKLQADEVFIFIPFLWNAVNKNIENTIRKMIPAEEKYFLTQQEIRKYQSLK